jgi:hypothetical protein
MDSGPSEPGPPKKGERRVTDVLTVSKVRLFTETEVARPEAVCDDTEPTTDEPIGQPGLFTFWMTTGAANL